MTMDNWTLDIDCRLEEGSTSDKYYVGEIYYNGDLLAKVYHITFESCQMRGQTVLNAIKNSEEKS